MMGGSASASGVRAPQADAQSVAVIASWDAQARKAAVQRDLVVDHRGLGYLRVEGRAPIPYGHTTPAAVNATSGGREVTAMPAAGPSSPSPVSAPSIGSLDPTAGATIGGSYTFKATVTDPEGVRSVTFNITPSGGSTSAFKASNIGSNVWAIYVSGMWDGSWSWQVVAKDGGPKGGATGTSPSTSFTVSGAGAGGGTTTGTTIANAQWTTDDIVKRTVGRIFFRMPDDSSLVTWSGYVCSGTAVSNSSGNSYSLILTAGHCVYDDVNKVFARDVLFIPDQAATTGTRTDLDCSNDRYGCWTPTLGYVDNNWATRTWPNNIPWDYAFYSVPNSGRYTAGQTTVSAALESNGTMTISFSPASGYVTGIGYPYNYDPQLRYCAQTVSTSSSGLFLSKCTLSGGASGGPWLTNATTNSRLIVSLNSWGYSGRAGMGGPYLNSGNSTAQCVYDYANAGTGSATSVTRGFTVSCP